MAYGYGYRRNYGYRRRQAMRRLGYRNAGYVQRNYYNRGTAKGRYQFMRSDGMGVRFKLRQVVPFEIPPGTTFGEFVTSWFSLTNPIYPYNSENDPYQDWTNIANLYDYYRPTGLKIKYIPQFNVSEVNLVSNTSTSGILPMYVAHDYDNIDTTDANMLTADDMLEYENCKVFSSARQWKHYVKVPPYTTIKNPELNIIDGLKKDGFIPTDNTGYNGILGVGFQSPVTTTTSDTNIGTFVVTLYLTARGRK